MNEPPFDAEGLFDEDYLHFYAEPLDANADADAELIWRLLELEPGMEVLDLACGHGRIAGALASRGLHVTGLDATPLFLEQARRDAASRRIAVTYVEGDMRSLPLPWTGRFDRVINWFTAFGYFDDTDNRRVLEEAARVLKPGGGFALEMNNHDWVVRHFQPATVDERKGRLLIDRRRFEPLTGRVVAQRTLVRDGQVRHIPFFRPRVHLHGTARLAGQRGLLPGRRLRRERFAAGLGEPPDDHGRTPLTAALCGWRPCADARLARTAA